MSAILLKSYTGEIFLSLSILLQLIFNIRLINNKKYNFPEISLETFYQCFFILLITVLLIYKSKIEGSFYGSFLVNDSSTKTLKVSFLFLSFFVLPVLYKSFKFQKLNFFEYCNLFLLSIFALLLMINAGNLLSFYILMEMQALCYYILATFRRNSIFSTEAGLKYFIAGSFISGFYLLGSSIVYGCLGTLNLNEIYLLLTIPLEDYNSLLSFSLKLGLLLIIGTLLFKLACFPFHFWAPDVYEGAPITSTLIFSVFPKISIISFFIKIVNTFITADINNMSIILNIVLVFACMSTIYGTFLALNQKRLKRLVVYSSIAQTGFLVAGISLGTLNGYIDTYFFLFVYLITSILIWSYFILFYEGYSKSSEFFNQEIKPLYITSLENLYRYNSVFALPLVIIFFSIGGIPPLSGFLIKMLILYDLIKENLMSYSIILLFVSAISIYYYIRVIKIVYFEPKKTVKSSFFFFQNENDMSDLSFVVISFFTFALVYLFFFPTLLILVCQYIAVL
jgi:NADH-quinone oxidoreductase subunit N